MVIPVFRAGSSRVTHPFATSTTPVLRPKQCPFDLHVLGTPPAFVLSQDQTLHRNRASASPSHFQRGETRVDLRETVVCVPKNWTTIWHIINMRNCSGLLFSQQIHTNLWFFLCLVVKERGARSSGPDIRGPQRTSLLLCRSQFSGEPVSEARRNTRGIHRECQ
jgi:hypothetical protein